MWLNRRQIAATLLCLPLAACSLPGSRENLSATREIISQQTSADLQWRRDRSEDEAARAAAAALIADGIALDEAVALGLLLNPEVQLAFEQLEISRADVVKAATPPNPVAIVGVRDAGGSLAVFYPERTVSVGLVQDVLALLLMPDRMAVARHELERQRLLVADRIAQFAQGVTDAWLEHAAAARIVGLREDAAEAARATFDALTVQAASDGEYSDLDIALERIGLFEVEAAAIRASLEAAGTRARLAELMGLAGFEEAWELADELPGLPDADPDAAVLEEAAITRRADIRAAAKAIDARLRVLSSQRRFRWLGALEIGAFSESAIDSASFFGPNAALEIPLFDQRQSELLAADAELRSALRTLEATRLAARTQLRARGAELVAARRLLEQHAKLVQPGLERIAEAIDEGDGQAAQELRLRLALLEADEQQLGLLRDYWRARSALALAAGEWSALSGLAIH